MRKSIPVAFFSLMSTLLIFGTVVMGGSELVLFSLSPKRWCVSVVPMPLS